MLVPVCELHAADERLLERLGQWRRENSFAFPAQGPVTPDGPRTLAARGRSSTSPAASSSSSSTASAIPSATSASRPATACALEVTDVVRGEKTVQPGLMSAAVAGLLAWAEDCFRARAGPPARAREPARDPLLRARRLPRRRPRRRRRAGHGVGAGAGGHGRADPDRRARRSRPREVAYATDAARHGWNSRWSGYIARFEREFAEYVGAEHAIATSSCTGALHMADARDRPRTRRRGDRPRADLGGDREGRLLRRRDARLRRRRAGQLVPRRRVGRVGRSPSARRPSSPSICTATRPTWTRCGPWPTATGCR